jgi:hypothetical protein
MKGTEVIEKIGAEKTHCFLEREMIEIDPEHDYLIVRGTEDHPRICCPEHEERLRKGKYYRLEIIDGFVVADEEWTTGHHPFEGDVEPKFTPKRKKNFFIK